MDTWIQTDTWMDAWREDILTAILKHRPRTSNEMPRAGVGDGEAVVLPRGHGGGRLLQRLLHAVEVGLGVVGVGCDHDALPLRHARDTHEVNVSVKLRHFILRKKRILA
jgi:hypothetical protein